MDAISYYSGRFSSGFITRRYTAMDAGVAVNHAPFGAE